VFGLIQRDLINMSLSMAVVMGALSHMKTTSIESVYLLQLRFSYFIEVSRVLTPSF
jgi:hypothetical protein